MDTAKLGKMAIITLAGQEKVYEHAIYIHNLRTNKLFTKFDITGWSIHDYRSEENPGIERVYVTVNFETGACESFQFLEAFAFENK